MFGWKVGSSNRKKYILLPRRFSHQNIEFGCHFPPLCDCKYNQQNTEAGDALWMVLIPPLQGIMCSCPEGTLKTQLGGGFMKK